MQRLFLKRKERLKMSDAVAVAIISGGLALLGVIITSISTSRNVTAQLERN